MYSLRQPDSLYARALTNAWQQVEQRRAQLAAEYPGSKFKLLEVSYDPTMDESIIEELPEVPKSSRPRAVRVSVRLRATYALQPNSEKER